MSEKEYEMTSPFCNDPTVIVAIAFRMMFPALKYSAQIVDHIEGEYGQPVFGETFFPDDGGNPIISISADAPIGAEAELLAHELAHVVAGKDDDHGPKWEKVFDDIFRKYNEIAQKLILGGKDETDLV